VRRSAPTTFATKGDAEGWLATRRAEITGDEWRPPTKVAPLLFAEYAATWLERRDLKPKTRHEYAALLRLRLLPTFGHVPLKAITSDMVEGWHFDQGKAAPTATARAYGLLRTLLGDAVLSRKIPYNPVHIRGAGNVKREREPLPATLPELAVMVEATPERFRLMVLLAAWCALRFGEVTELRRSDVDMTRGVVRVRRGVTRTPGEVHVGDPKSDAGSRDVAIPPHLLPVVRAHLAASITGGRDGLLFPAADRVSHLAESSMTDWWYPARKAAGRDDLTFHGLRHTGATLAAATGATLAELMARLGHSTQGAALRYQHATADRDTEIARLLSGMVEQAS